MIDLHGHHAAITGGGSGIGLAIAQVLSTAGADITLMGRTRARLRAAADGIARNGRGPHVVTLDVTKGDSVQEGFEEAAHAAGPITILVNNAGGTETKPFRKISAADWQTALDLNLTGTFLCTQVVLPGMIEADTGRIINIASTAGLKGYAYAAAYTAAKHGVVGMTRALAVELSKTGITVNALCPGFTNTELVRNAIGIIVEKTGRSADEVLAEFAAFNPQNRLIEPDEVAMAALWLASEGAKSITGQAIAIAGGEVM